VNGNKAASPGGLIYNQGLVAMHGVITAPAIFWEGFDCFIDSRYQARGQKSCGLTWTQPDASVSLWNVRGAVTDAQGKILTSANPAKLGQVVSIWASGLGPFGKTADVISNVANAPLYGDPIHNAIGPYRIPVLYAGESSAFPGLFQINVQIPVTLQCGDPAWGLPAWPSGTYNWDLQVSIMGYDGISQLTDESKAVWVPVSVRPGDVQCGK